MALTMFVVSNGVANGIEKWSTRLMPLLFILFGLLTVYIFHSARRMGWVNHVLSTQFQSSDTATDCQCDGTSVLFSLIGVCVMTTYGSYLKKETNIL
ncbi:hypothetical protein ACT691_16975 [Vibrio metschnikovii]